MTGRENDVVVVGAGINGLICGLLLARSGLAVEIVEAKPAVGGMSRAEFPLAKAPRLPVFTGTHRPAFLPAELAAQLSLDVSRDPSTTPTLFVPTTSPGRHLLAGDTLDHASGGVVGGGDARALAAMAAELDALVADLAPAWTTSIASVEEVAERHVRPTLRESFVRLCRGSLAEYVAQFDLESALVKAALAAETLVGSFASWESAGTGVPLLVRHAMRRAGAVSCGSLGALARTLAERAQGAGAVITTGATVTQIGVEGNTVTGVVLGDGRSIQAGSVVVSADPWRLRALVGTERLTHEYNRRIDALSRTGSVAKLNVALAQLPRFSSLDDERGQHRATTFLVPGAETDALRTLGQAFADASAGRIPGTPVLECTFPSAADDTLRDPDGRHSAAIVVPWAPYDLAGTTWAAEEENLTGALLDTVERFAPGTRALVTDAVLHHPKKLEAQLGITRGHLGHVDDTFAFGDRLGPATPILGLYSCGRSAGPAGGVLGVAGLDAFRRVLADLELALERTEIGVRE